MKHHLETEFQQSHAVAIGCTPKHCKEISKEETIGVLTRCAKTEKLGTALYQHKANSQAVDKILIADACKAEKPFVLASFEQSKDEERVLTGVYYAKPFGKKAKVFMIGDVTGAAPLGLSLSLNGTLCFNRGIFQELESKLKVIENQGNTGDLCVIPMNGCLLTGFFGPNGEVFYPLNVSISPQPTKTVVNPRIRVSKEYLSSASAEAFEEGMQLFGNSVEQLKKEGQNSPNDLMRLVNLKGQRQTVVNFLSNSNGIFNVPSGNGDLVLFGKDKKTDVTVTKGSSIVVKLDKVEPKLAFKANQVMKKLNVDVKELKENADKIDLSRRNRIAKAFNKLVKGKQITSRYEYVLTGAIQKEALRIKNLKEQVANQNQKSKPAFFKGGLVALFLCAISNGIAFFALGVFVPFIAAGCAAGSLLFGVFVMYFFRTSPSAAKVA